MLNEISEVSIKALVAVSTLFILTRMMGKKQISHLTLFDYVIGISIGSVAASFAVETNVSYIDGLTSIVVFALFPVALSILSVKSYTLRKLFDGKPLILIQNGKIVEGNIKKARLTINDLVEECRLKDVFDLSEIDYAIFETSGKLSILKKSPSMPVTRGDMQLNIAGAGMYTLLIVDGKLIEANLETLKLKEEWLKEELKKQKITDYSSVLLCCIDGTKKLIVDRKNSDPKITPIM